MNTPAWKKRLRQADFIPGKVVMFIIVFFLLVFVYSLLSRRLEQTVLTVVLSIFAHGLNVSRGIQLYASRITRLPSGASEYEANVGLQTI